MPLRSWIFRLSPRDSIPRPKLVRAADLQAWLWRPPEVEKPRVAVLVSSEPTRPVFDKRIAALNFAGLAVLAVNGPGAQKAAIAFLRDAADLDGRAPLLLNPDGLPVEQPAQWSKVVDKLDPDQPDLAALVKHARGTGAL